MAQLAVTLTLAILPLVSLLSGFRIDGRNNEERFQGGKVVAQPAPFIVGLIVKDGGNFCVGTLISANRVLTAATCFPSVVQNFTLQAVLGLSDITVGSVARNKDKDNVSVLDFRFEDVVLHPDYKDDPNIVNDIAVIKLVSSVKEGFKPITLSSDDAKFKVNIKGAGWGMENCWTGSPDDLREAEGTYVEKEECSKFSPNITETQTCVTFVSEGNIAAMANGDGGGPLYSVTDSSTPVQIGIASFVEIIEPFIPGTWMCVNKTVPQVYTRVSSFKSFILEHAPEAKFTP